MKKETIHNLDTLEKEIYRLELEIRNKEEKLKSNMDRLQNNYGSMFRNSFFSKKEKKDHSWSGFFHLLFGEDPLKTVLSSATERISENTAQKINALIDKLFRRKSDQF